MTTSLRPRKHFYFIIFYTSKNSETLLDAYETIISPPF
jgi:hypothetical protein